MIQGSCLCGAVSFTVAGGMGAPIACHCRECRQQSGHYCAAAPAQKSAVTMMRDEGLAWYKASTAASRGFCRNCGSTLFWQNDESKLAYVQLGVLDGSTGLHLASHVWVSEKGDYYDIADDLKQFEEG